jgi:hypothetical protein
MMPRVARRREAGRGAKAARGAAVTSRPPGPDPGPGSGAWPREPWPARPANSSQAPAGQAQDQGLHEQPGLGIHGHDLAHQRRRGEGRGQAQGDPRAGGRGHTSRTRTPAPARATPQAGPGAGAPRRNSRPRSTLTGVHVVAQAGLQHVPRRLHGQMNRKPVGGDERAAGREQGGPRGARSGPGGPRPAARSRAGGRTAARGTRRCGGRDLQGRQVGQGLPVGGRSPQDRKAAKASRVAEADGAGGMAVLRGRGPGLARDRRTGNPPIAEVVTTATREARIRAASASFFQDSARLPGRTPGAPVPPAARGGTGTRPAPELRAGKWGTV